MTHSLAADLRSILRVLRHAALCSMLLHAHRQVLAQPASCASEAALLRSIVTWADIENAIAFRFGEERPFTDDELASQDARTGQPLSNEMRFDIGATYLTGKRAENDSQRAFGWFLSAAKHGDVEAAMIVAYLYATGTGTPANCREATKWFCQAGDSGIEEVKYAMGTRCSSTAERDPRSPPATR